MNDYQLKIQDLPTWKQRTALRVLHWFGWRMLAAPLPGPRGIAVVYPHTSNWDFIVGVLGKWALDLPFRWLAKDSLFKIPLLSTWFRWMGGEPVDRSARNGMIKAQAERMNAADWYWVGITPEASRSYRPHWKSGFYYLALEAKVPLTLVYLDYPNKTLGLTTHIHLTGDMEQDMAAIRAGFEGHQGLYPQNQAPIVLADRSGEARRK